MQLSIRDVVFEVFRFLWDNRLDLLRMVAAPVVALSICSVLISLTLTSEPPADPKVPSPSHIVASLLSYALQLIFYVMFAVAWHRRCLRSEEQTTILSALKWDRRKTLFLARFFVILLVMIAASLPPALVVAIAGGGASMGLAAGGVGGSATGPLLVEVVKAIAIVFMLLVQTRLALWLPAAALDHKMTLMEAWVVGRRNSWRLVAIFLERVLVIFPSVSAQSRLPFGFRDIAITLGFLALFMLSRRLYMQRVRPVFNLPHPSH